MECSCLHSSRGHSDRPPPQSRSYRLLRKPKLQITKEQRAKNVILCSSILSSDFQPILTNLTNFDLPLGIKLKAVFRDDDLLHSPFPHRWMGWGSYKVSGFDYKTQKLKR